MMRAWFAGADLPLDLQLSLEVDGHPWGERFTSRITSACSVNAGLFRFPQLYGCRTVGLRREAASGG
jgi:hypothetical protein